MRQIPTTSPVSPFRAGAQLPVERPHFSQLPFPACLRELDRTGDYLAVKNVIGNDPIETAYQRTIERQHAALTNPRRNS